MTSMKGRLKAAQKGHSLLKKKADALQLRFRMILKKIVETKQTMGEVMKEAAFSLAEAKFASGDFSQVQLLGFFQLSVIFRSSIWLLEKVELLNLLITYLTNVQLLEPCLL